MKIINLTLNLPDELLAQLVLRAREQGVTLEEMVVELLHDTFDEPTNAEIIAGIREGMRDAMLGNTRSADEVLDELDADMRQSD